MKFKFPLKRLFYEDELKRSKQFFSENWPSIVGATIGIILVAIVAVITNKYFPLHAYP